MQNKDTTNKVSKADIPTLLYHYTSSAGLKGIIKGNIWTTKIRYMNDNSELNLALKYIREEIEHQKSNPYDRIRNIGDLNEMLNLTQVSSTQISLYRVSRRIIGKELPKGKSCSCDG